MRDRPSPLHILLANYNPLIRVGELREKLIEAGFCNAWPRRVAFTAEAAHVSTDLLECWVSYLVLTGAYNEH